MERQSANDGGGGSERDVRRRRREAVVIHDGEGVVGSEDLFMRDQEGRMDVGELVADEEQRENGEALQELDMPLTA
jgi:hypothetical protein